MTVTLLVLTSHKPLLCKRFVIWAKALSLHCSCGSSPKFKSFFSVERAYFLLCLALTVPAAASAEAWQSTAVPSRRSKLDKT